MKDKDGDLLHTFVEQQVVRISDIAWALEFSEINFSYLWKDFSELWKELPLDGNRIAKVLKKNRDNVIWLRRDARKRLEKILR